MVRRRRKGKHLSHDLLEDSALTSTLEILICKQKQIIQCMKNETILVFLQNEDSYLLSAH